MKGAQETQKTELSPSRDRSLVVKISAAENARSASTDVGGTCSK